MPVGWVDDVDRLLYDGEYELRRVDFDTAAVVVTSHRILAFSPEDLATAEDEPRYRQLDRPNVAGVSVGGGGDVRHLVRTAAAGLLGIGLFVAATRVSFVEFFDSADVDGGAGAGVGGTVGIVEGLLAAFDLAMVVGGFAALGAAAIFGGYYLYTRSRVLVLEVYGGEDVTLPIGDADIDAEAVATLEAAIRKPGGSTEGGLGSSDESTSNGSAP